MEEEDFFFLKKMYKLFFKKVKKLFIKELVLKIYILSLLIKVKTGVLNYTLGVYLVQLYLDK